MSGAYKYVFGPVPSRRLGRSLGVDLLPPKTCTMDCSYCQLGATTHAVAERGDFVPIAEVLDELDRWFGAGGEADHITLAGSGEPTLHLHFGNVFKWARDNTDIPSVLLTNGTLLYLPEVRASAALADKVKVTLSAWDEVSFQKIHRPARGITFDQLIEGEMKFRQEFEGELSVEVFIVDGLNSQVAHAKEIAEMVALMNPDRIDINTVVRPPTDQSAKAPPQDRLAELAKIFGPKAEVTASYKKQGFQTLEVSDEALLNLISRHPATCKQLAEEFNYPEEHMLRALSNMVAAGMLKAEQRGDEHYFFCR